MCAAGNPLPELNVEGSVLAGCAESQPAAGGAVARELAEDLKPRNIVRVQVHR